jgi:3-phytase
VVAVEDASDYFSDLFSSSEEQQAAARAIEEIQKSSGGLDNLIDKLTYTLPAAQAVEAISQAVQQEATRSTTAAFDNLLGFYVVADAATGAVTDADGNLILPGEAGYAEAALANVGFNIQVGGSQTGEVGISTLVGGVAYAPFVIANGAQFANNPASVFGANPDNQAATAENYTTLPVVYFGFAEANPDFAPHIKRLSGDVFGFEDLPGGIGVSDNDFNDAVFAFNFTNA